MAHAVRAMRKTATVVAVVVLLALAGRVEAQPAGAAPPTTLVVFGNGDLAKRKIYPSLAQAWKAGTLSPDLKIVAAARDPMARQAFLRELRAGVRKLGKVNTRSAAWKAIESRIEYRAVDLTKPTTVKSLSDRLDRIDAGGSRARMLYLAVTPSILEPAIDNLAGAGLLTRGDPHLLVEKPFGRDLRSARALDRALHGRIPPDRVMRMDHYLGKAAIEDLGDLRRNDPELAAVWNRDFIDRVEISASESIGIEGRGNFYEETGALRDFAQGHLVQMLAATAAEPSAPEDARAARTGVVRALRPFDAESVQRDVLRMQYRGYRAEPGVAVDSQVETYVAIRAHVDNARWRGVPFMLESGKALGQKRSSIRVHLKRLTPELARRLGARADRPAVLEVEVDPSPRITLRSGRKKLTLADGSGRPDAYERLLVRAMRGEEEAFVGDREVEAAWEWVRPIQEAWESPGAAPIAQHRQGARRPTAAQDMFRAAAQRHASVRPRRLRPSLVRLSHSRQELRTAWSARRVPRVRRPTRPSRIKATGSARR